MDRLQWGNRKRLRCVKVKDSVLNGKSADSNGNGDVLKKKITSRVDRRVVHDEQDSAAVAAHPLPPLQSPHRHTRDLGMNRSSANEGRKMMSTLSSPEKEDRYYTTRGSGGLVDESTHKLFMEAKEEKKKLVWPKLFISLSNKEKEEDFMAMKGCKLPQRPKKRAKLIQRSLLLVSPGAWLSDLCQERYEVREKKTSKKVVAKKVYTLITLVFSRLAKITRNRDFGWRLFDGLILTSVAETQRIEGHGKHGK